MILKNIHVVSSKWKETVFAREVVGWSISLDYGRSGRFVGSKIYKSIDSAFRAESRIRKKLLKALEVEK